MFKIKHLLLLIWRLVDYLNYFLSYVKYSNLFIKFFIINLNYVFNLCYFSLLKFKILISFKCNYLVLGFYFFSVKIFFSLNFKKFLKYSYFKFDRQVVFQIEKVLWSYVSSTNSVYRLISVVYVILEHSLLF